MSNLEFKYKEVDVNKTFEQGAQGEAMAIDYIMAKLIQGGMELKDLILVPAPDKYHPEWDFKILHSTGLEASYEVKLDISGHKYGNLFVETQNGSGTPTGVYATTAKWWIHLFPQQKGSGGCEVFVFNTERLRYQIARGAFKIKTNSANGNGWAAGAILPREQVIKMGKDIGLTVHEVIIY